jgi:hypothetical protein
MASTPIVDDEEGFNDKPNRYYPDLTRHEAKQVALVQ